MHEPLPVLISSHEPFVTWVLPCPISQVSARVAVAVKWYPARVNPSHRGDINLAKNFGIFHPPCWKLAHNACSSHFHTVHNLPFFLHGQQYQLSLIYTPKCSYMHTDGVFLVLWSDSSTCSRSKMKGVYDNQRKRSELSTEDLKENYAGLYIFQRTRMEIHKLNVIIVIKL